MTDLHPLEAEWSDAYAAWWEAVLAGDWDAEQRLRNVMSMAWTRVPGDAKAGAWDRYRERVGWPRPVS